MNVNSADDESRPMIVRVVSEVLERLICGHTSSPKICPDSGNGFLKFKSSYAPEVSIEAYLIRIRKYSRCSDACIVMALVYIDRLIESKALILSNLNVHRLLITSVMLAAKFHDDLFYNNAYYSKLGGITLQELNHLEIELLQLLDNSLFVSEDYFSKYIAQLQNFVHCIESEPVISVNSIPPESGVPVKLQVSLPGSLTVGVPRIPSPNNPHAENGFGEYSPCRIGPASITPQRSNVVPTYGHQGLLQSFQAPLHYEFGLSTQEVLFSVNATSAYPCSGLRDYADDATTTSCSTRSNSPYAPAVAPRTCGPTFAGAYGCSTKSYPVLTGVPDLGNTQYFGTELIIDTNPQANVFNSSVYNPNLHQPMLYLQHPCALLDYGETSLSGCTTQSSATNGCHVQMTEKSFSVDDSESLASGYYGTMNYNGATMQESASFSPFGQQYWPQAPAVVTPSQPAYSMNDAELLARYQQQGGQLGASQLYGTDFVRSAAFPAPGMQTWS